MIIDHIVDSHDWHIATFGHAHITIPLPIILLDTFCGPPMGTSLASAPGWVASTRSGSWALAKLAAPRPATRPGVAVGRAAGPLGWPVAWAWGWGWLA